MKSSLTMRLNSIRRAMNVQKNLTLRSAVCAGSWYGERRKTAFPLAGDRLDDRLPVEDLLQRQLGIDERDTCPVCQYLLDRDFAFPSSGKLGPILGDGCGELQLAPLEQKVLDGRCPPLGGGEHDGKRVFLPGLFALRSSSPRSRAPRSRQSRVMAP